MAIPVIQTRSETKVVANAGELTLTAPSGITDGDVLVIAIALDGNSTVVFPSGFTTIDAGTAPSGRASLYVAYKIASSESGDYTSTWGDGTEQGIGEMYRVDGADSGNEIQDPGESNTGTSANATITPVAATDQADALVLVFAGIDRDRVTADTGGDADYTTEDIDESGGANGAAIGVQSRGQASTGVPPQCDLTLDASDEWRTIWFAIRGPVSSTRRVRVSAFDLEVPNAARTVRVSAFDFEVPDAPRTVQISAFDFETPNAARTVQITAFDFETGEAARTVQVSAFDFEAPNLPRTVQVSAFDLEIEDAARTVQVSAFDFETPDAARTVRISAFDFETPVPPRKVVVSAFDFEVPADTDRTVQVSAFDLEVPNAARTVRVSAFDFEIGDAARTTQVSAFDFEVGNAPRTVRVSAFTFNIEDTGGQQQCRIWLSRLRIGI